MLSLGRRYVGSIVIVIVAASTGQAQEDQRSDPRFLAQAFIGNCAQNVGRIDKVEAAARVLKYRPLEGDMKAMIAPQDPNATFSGWLVVQEGENPFLLGVSEGQINGVQYSNCVIADPYVEMDALIRELQTLVTFGRVLDAREEAGQRYRVWETPEIAEKSFVSITDAPQMYIVGGSISLSAPTAK